MVNKSKNTPLASKDNGIYSILLSDLQPLSTIKKTVIDKQGNSKLIVYNDWLFTDKTANKSLQIKNEQAAEVSESKQELKSETKAILDYIYEVLQKKSSSAFTLLDKKKENDEKILYRPYESSTHSPEWMAGRYVGEMVMVVPKQGQVKLRIEPRFGTLFLCHMLEEIYNFKIPESVKRQADGDFWNKFYQLILRQLWIAKFAKADQYGLPRQTVKRTHQGMQIRGHLNVRKSILPFFTKKEVVSEYREKEVDDMIGRIVYKAYDILADKETGLRHIPPQVQESINDLYSRYHGEQIKIAEHDYQSIRYKSIYVSWKPLVDFSWQIIKHRGYNPEQSTDEQGYGLFFDMAEIWETYVGKLLEKDFVHCTERDSNIRLFENEEEKQFQRIIPDYLSRDWTNEKAIAVGDAKYMTLANKETLQGEQTNSVYYKTIMYMYRFNSQKGFIFYPMKHDDSAKDVQEFQIAGDKQGKFYMVGLRLPEENDKDYLNKLKKHEDNFREAVSKKLGFQTSATS